MADELLYDALHKQAMSTMDEAEDLLRQKRYQEATAKFAEAAGTEELAAFSVPKDKPKTIGILRRSAVTLWQLAGDHEKVAQLAREFLKEPSLPGFDQEMKYALDDALARVAKEQR
jgi:hypothetical protein